MPVLKRPPVACPGCAHSPIAPRFDLGDYSVARCDACDLLFNYTFYDDEEFQSSLFQPEYYDTNVAFQHRADAYRADPSLSFYAEHLEWVERHAGKGRVLDVGCAFGNFLKLAEERGWDPRGVEL